MLLFVASCRSRRLLEAGPFVEHLGTQITMFQFFMYINGCGVGFYRGDVKLLMDDIGKLRPTVFPSVPRLLNRIYDKVRM